tara:strand:- start:24891 stop:25979 length:1089 start_codon:yes stop_codon:yes gene_type:complete
MPTYQTTPQFEHGKRDTTGILVVNLGTPAAPTSGAVRRFLRQFLSDPRVVELPRALWWLILNLVILLVRPSRSAAAYQKIWTENGSPLLLYSTSLSDKIRTRLAANSAPTDIELAMTYGNPSVDSAIDKLLARGAQRILVLPLYPQYSGTTTASVYDAVNRKLGKLRWVPEIRFINSYHDEPAYISALADSVQSHWQQHGRGDKLLMSFHGIPKKNLERGDPYFCQSQKTARLLAAALDLADDDWVIAFQSRVGAEEWLSPYTDETVKLLAHQGISKLDVVCPGFATDCLETLEEIAMQNAEFFTAAGGESLRYIPALNDDDNHVELLAALATRHMAGWVSQHEAAKAAETRERALAMGAPQ